MGQEEAQVEGRIAGVGAFEIEEDQAVGVHQDILRAEVAQDERPLIDGEPSHGRDEVLDARSQVRMATGDRPIIRIDAQFVEQARVRQGPPQGGMSGGIGVDRAQDRPQPGGDSRIDPSGHQVSLPGDRVVGGAGHREEIIRSILEQDMGDGPLGQDRAEDSESGGLGPDPIEAGMPFHRDAKPLAALFDHERRLTRDLDPQHDVRDPARQLPDVDLGIGRNMP